VLVQEVAYESLLKTRRRELHRAIAQVLVEKFPAVAEAQPELLAQHWTAAGDAEAAVAAWQRAGDRAKEWSAYAQAADHYTKAIEMLGALPEVAERAQRELPLRLALGYVLQITKGYASREAAETFTRARALGEQMTDTRRVFYLLQALFATTLSQGEVRAAQELADQLLYVAERDGTPAMLTWAHWAQAATRYARGEPATALTHAERALSHYRMEDHRRTLMDPGLIALGTAGQAAWQLGFPGQALRRARELLDLGQRLTGLVHVAVSLEWAAMIEAQVGELDRALEHAERGRQLIAEQQLPYHSAWGDVIAGRLYALRGRYAEGIARLHDGLRVAAATGTRLARGLFLGYLAEAQLVAGVVADGLATIEDALAAVPDEQMHLPELLRLRGELRAAAGANAAAVEESYREAMALARRLGAKMQELRATSSLGRFLRTHGRAAEARELLAPIYASFTEGFDTRDLIEAKALLEELG